MRLFVAIDIPDALRERLGAISQRLGPGFRDVDPANIHLTLKFLGEVPPEKLPKVVAALREVPFKSFGVETTKLGCFAHVFWLGVRLDKHLAQLQKEVQRAVRPFAMNDPRPYKPHLTIARFEDLLPHERAAMDALLDERLEERWKAETFKLYRSVLTEDGPIYSVVAAFPKIVTEDSPDDES